MDVRESCRRAARAADEHAFYCGCRIPTIYNGCARQTTSTRNGSANSTPDGRDAVADLMADVVAHGGVQCLVPGAAEPGRAHRPSIDHGQSVRSPTTRERLNERVKYREAIRPLAPMANDRGAR